MLFMNLTGDSRWAGCQVAGPGLLSGSPWLNLTLYCICEPRGSCWGPHNACRVSHSFLSAFVLPGSLAIPLPSVSRLRLLKGWRSWADFPFVIPWEWPEAVGLYLGIFTVLAQRLADLNKLRLFLSFKVILHLCALPRYYHLFCIDTKLFVSINGYQIDVLYGDKQWDLLYCHLKK